MVVVRKRVGYRDGKDEFVGVDQEIFIWLCENCECEISRTLGIRLRKRIRTSNPTYA